MGLNQKYIDSNPTSSCGFAADVTPGDSTIIPTTRGLYVGTSGNVRVVFYNASSPVTLVGVPAGSLLPIRVKQIYSTGTTASNIVAMY